MTSQPALALEPKLRPQLGTEAQVRRTALLDLLEASSRIPVAAIIAPPGYGKTTLLAQWAERDPRAFAWLTIDRRDNDPSVLLRDLVAAYDQVTPIGRVTLELEDAPGAAIDAVLPRLGSALSAAAQPAVLVLDDIHLLRDGAGLEAVARLIEYLPGGSQLAIASRGEPSLPLARLRAEGRVLELGPGDLAMDTAEASSLLERGEVDVGRVDVEELLRRTEGWPVALHFAALSLGAGRLDAAKAGSLAPDDRFMAGYLEFELLSRLPPGLVSFLIRCSVLERMSGPLCDAMLAGTGSADLLESLSRSDLLVVPLDRRRQWYRFHRLLRELLRAELERREPTLAVELTRRAAEWCEEHELPEPAVAYAMAAGDADRAARLVVNVAPATYAAGRIARLRQWFGWFEANQLIERYPAVAVLGAGINAVSGRPVAAQRWADAAREATADGIGSHGDTSVDGPLALLEAALCRRGVEQMAADAERARALAPTGSARQASAQLLLGISQLLTGDLDQADRSLADAAEVGAEVGTGSAVVAMAERSLLAMARGAWQQAGALAERASAGVRSAWLEQYPSGALLHAVTARLAIHGGDLPRAREDLARAGRLRGRLTWALPHLAVQVRLELARTYLALTDATAARTLLLEVDDLLSRRPRLGLLRDQASELRAQLDTMRMAAVGVSSLTAAEVRLLRLLGTHHSFREIGEQLGRSQHTVKSQAMSIYRKFGVSSRSEAVRSARGLGLLVE
jgi:LuxR family transcriptional regulator, maltose regulon positive regulatory protein